MGKTPLTAGPKSVQAAQALDELDIYRTLFQSAYDALYVLDHAQDRFLMANDAFLKLTGYDREELLGSGLTGLSLIVPEQRREVEAKRKELGTIPAESYEVKIRRKPGEIRDLELSVRRMTLSDRVIVLGSARDITERKQDEETLRESEAQFRSLAEATTEGICFEENGLVLYANQTLAALFGYTLPELIGKNSLDLVSPESREFVAKQVKAGTVKPYEALGTRKDGSTFPYEARAKAIPYQGRSVRVVAVRDITQIKQMAASLERQVRLEKKKTLEAFQANVRIFQLTEKIRAAYESTTHLVNSRNIGDLLASAVKLLCDPAGLDYREAALYVAREGSLELHASSPERPADRIPCGADHPLAATFREESGLQAPAGGLILPLKGQAGPVGVLEVSFHSTEEARSWQENILRTLANSLSLMIDNLNLYEVVRRQSITDALTGLHNRRYFDEKLAVEVERAVRYKRSMTLVLIDLDDFKKVNDTYGHPQGDAVLAEIGALLTKQSRHIDIVSRYGGEEFGLILPETGLANAVLHADRLRETIAGRSFANLRRPEKPLHLTASFGVAEVDAEYGSPETVLNAADSACYAAKHAGKNRVSSSSAAATR